MNISRDYTDEKELKKARFKKRTKTLKLPSYNTGLTLEKDKFAFCLLKTKTTENEEEKFFLDLYPLIPN